VLSVLCHEMCYFYLKNEPKCGALVAGLCLHITLH